MRILDKFILKEFASTFLFGVAAFTSIFIGADLLFRIAQLLTTYGASVWAVTKVFIFALPRIIVYTFPMSVLLGALMTVARTSGNSELIVMRAAGQSFLRLLAPVFVVAFFISMGTVVFNEFVVPASTAAYSYTIDHEIKGNIRPQAQEHIVLKDVRNGTIQNLLYARKYDAQTETLENITLQQFESDRLVRIENAPSAKWLNGKWVMSNGVIYDLSDNNQNQERTLRFEEQILPFTDTPTQLQKVKKKPEEMGVRELRQEIQAYEAAGADTRGLVMELHRRFSLPLASFVFALLGAPLGLQKQRSSSSLGFGISVVVIFCYYAMMTFTAALGEGGVLPPVLAIWAPDLVALIVGIYLLRRIDN